MSHRGTPSKWGVHYKLKDSYGHEFRSGKASYSYEHEASWYKKPCIVLYSYGHPTAIMTPAQLPGHQPRVRDYDENSPVQPCSQTTARHVRAFEYQSEKLCRRLRLLTEWSSGIELKVKLA